MDKKLIASVKPIASCSQGYNRWPYFHNAVKIISETLCKNWERQSANGNCYRCSNVLSATLKSITSLRWCSHHRLMKRSVAQSVPDRASVHTRYAALEAGSA